MFSWRKRVGAITKEANANPRAAQHLAPVKKSPEKKKQIEKPSDSSGDGGELHTKWIRNVSSQSEKNEKEATKKKTNTRESEAAKNLVTKKPVSNALSQIGFVDSDDEDIEVKPQPIKVPKTKLKHAEVVPETQTIDSSDDEDSMLEKMKGKPKAKKKILFCTKKKTVSPPVCEEESTSSSENEGSQKINLKRILSQDSQETEQPMKKKQKRDEEITDDTSDQYSEEEVKSSNRKKTIVEYESEDFSSEEDVKPKSKKVTEKFLPLSLDSEDEQYIDYYEKQPKHKKAIRSDQEESDDSEDFDAMSSSDTEKGKKRVASDDEMDDDDDEFSDPELWDEEDDDVLEVYSSKKGKYDDIEEYDSMDDFIDQHYETKKKKQTSIKDFTKKGTSPIERKKRLHKNTKAVPDKLVNKENGWSVSDFLQINCFSIASMMTSTYSLTTARSLDCTLRSMTNSTTINIKE
jgi:hypothetical protein